MSKAERVLLTIKATEGDLVFIVGDGLRPCDLLDVIHGCTAEIARCFLKNGMTTDKAEVHIIQAVASGISQAVQDMEAKQ